MKLDSDGNGAFVSLWSILLFGFSKVVFFSRQIFKKMEGKDPLDPPSTTRQVCALALILEAHHLRCTPQMTVSGTHLFLGHLLRHIAVGKNTMAAVEVLLAHDQAQILVGNASVLDGTLPCHQGIPQKA